MRNANGPFAAEAQVGELRAAMQPPKCNILSIVSGSEVAQEFGEGRLFSPAGGGLIWRSPLFLFAEHGLLCFQSWDYTRPSTGGARSPGGQRLVTALAQLIKDKWQPLNITGAGGGGGARPVHWIELQRPDSEASAVRIIYVDPTLADVDDQITVTP